MATMTPGRKAFVTIAAIWGVIFLLFLAFGMIMARHYAQRWDQILVGAVLLPFVVIIYFLPAIVAFSRNHPQTASIAALNLFLGETGIGWVVALIWALAKI